MKHVSPGQPGVQAWDKEHGSGQHTYGIFMTICHDS